MTRSSNAIHSLTLLAILVVIPGFATAQAPERGDTPGITDAQYLDIPRGRAPRVDGVLSPAEWDDAVTVTIAAGPGWEVPVRIKHDGQSLYIAFTNLKMGEAERYPEVLLAVRGERDEVWSTSDWWLHASYQDCEGQGIFNHYQCSPTKPGWEANNFPLDPPGTIEFRISFEKIGLHSDSASRIGIAFNVTDTRTVWSFWPETATMERPVSWADASISVGWGQDT